MWIPFFFFMDEGKLFLALCILPTIYVRKKRDLCNYFKVHYNCDNGVDDPMCDENIKILNVLLYHVYLKTKYNNSSIHFVKIQE